MFARKLLDGLESLSLVVANDMSFVQDAVIPADASEVVNVVLHHVVAGHDQRVILHHLP